MNIVLNNAKWILYLNHINFLSEEFKSTEIKIEKHFIDFRRTSPVPRCHITRIFFRPLNSKIEVYKCTLFSTDGSEVPGSSELLKQDVEFMFAEFISKK